MSHWRGSMQHDSKSGTRALKMPTDQERVIPTFWPLTSLPRRLDQLILQNSPFLLPFGKCYGHRITKIPSKRFSSSPPRLSTTHASPTTTLLVWASISSHLNLSTFPWFLFFHWNLPTQVYTKEAQWFQTHQWCPIALIMTLMASLLI